MIRPVVMRVNMEMINLMIMMMMIDSKYRKRCRWTGRSNKMKKLNKMFHKNLIRLLMLHKAMIIVARLNKMKQRFRKKKNLIFNIRIKRFKNKTNQFKREKMLIHKVAMNKLTQNNYKTNKKIKLIVSIISRLAQIKSNNKNLNS